MWGLIQFVIANAAALTIAHALASLIYASAHLSRRILATLVTYQVIVTVLTLALGLLGWWPHFWIPTVLLGLAAIPFVVRAWRPPEQTALADSAAVHRDWLASPPFLCSLVALCLVWGIRHGFMGGTLSFDDRTHHAAQVAQWFQDGSLAFHYLSYQSYHPGNAELFTLWFTLPIGNDALTPLVGLVYAAILVTLCFDCGLLLRLPVAASALAAGLLLTCKKLFLHALSFCDPALGLATLSCAAVVLTLPTRQTPGKRPLSNALAHSRVCLGGLVAGLALGMNHHALAFTLWTMIVTIWHVRSVSHVRSLSSAALFIMALLVTGGYWYLRNLGLTGNPIFPYGLGPLPGPLATDPGSNTFLGTLRETPPPERGIFLSQLADWSHLHLVAAAAGYIAAAISLLRRRHTDRRQRDAIATIMSIGMVNLALFPLQTFAGHEEGMVLETSGRPLFAGIIVGTLLFVIAIAPFVRGQGSNSKRITIALLWFSVVVVSLDEIRRTMVYLFLPISMVIMILWMLVRYTEPTWLRNTTQRWMRLWGHQIRFYACVIVFVECAAFYPISKARQDDAALKHWVALQVKRLPGPSTLALYDGQRDRHLAYDLFGRDWQHRVVRLRNDGQPTSPLHTRQRSEGTDFWDFEHGREHPLPSADVFVQHLRDAGIDYLVTTRNPLTSLNSAGTPQAELLHANGLLPVFAQSAYGTIWEVRTLESASLH